VQEILWKFYTGEKMPIEKLAIANLLALADAWCAATNSAISTVGKYAQSDPRFFTTLRDRYDALPNADNRGSCTFRIYDKVIAWFGDHSNWPADAEIPSVPYPLEPKEHDYGKSSERPRPPEGKPQQVKAPARSSGTSETLAKLRRGAGV
jgi:hypothetical protein